MEKEKMVEKVMNSDDTKAIAQIIASENEKEWKMAEIAMRRDQMERESEDRKAEIEVRQNEVDVKHDEIAMRETVAEKEHEAKMAEVQSKQEDTQAKIDIANAEQATEAAKIEAEEQRSKKERRIRIVGWIIEAVINLSLIGFAAWKFIKTIIFEEHGTIRNQASKVNVEKPIKLQNR